MVNNNNNNKKESYRRNIHGIKKRKNQSCTSLLNYSLKRLMNFSYNLKLHLYTT